MVDDITVASENPEEEPIIPRRGRRKVETPEIIEEETIPIEEVSATEVFSVPEIPVLQPEPLYRLNYRRSNGQIRAEISKSIVYILNVNWPDLLRVIPSTEWVTVDQIVALVRVWENSSPRKTFIRCKEDIERGLVDLISAGVLLRK